MLFSSMPTLILTGGFALGTANGLLYALSPVWVGTPPSTASATSIGSRDAPPSRSSLGLAATGAGGWSGSALTARPALEAGARRAPGAAPGAGAAYASEAPGPRQKLAYSITATAMISA